MEKTILQLNNRLPFTCSRKGTCCFGKQVLINPWELSSLAHAKGISASEFANQYGEYYGTKIKFNGTVKFKNRSSCSLYTENFGCSLHSGRPLACRLYPIGRQLQSNKVQYIFEGQEFPCLKDCAEVKQLPFMTVKEYLQDQKAEEFENAQDLYLELVQSIADIAFTLLFETGLKDTLIKSTIKKWTDLSESGIETLISEISADWLDWTIQPGTKYTDNSEEYIRVHAEYLQIKVQNKLEGPSSPMDFVSNSVNAFAAALILSFSLGVDYHQLGTHWIETANSQS